jgi:imidazolonepropionase
MRASTGGSGALVAPLALVPGRKGHGGPPQETPDVGIAWEDGVLTHVGPAGELPPALTASARRLVGGLVVPGFVDCHTHLPFAGWRADEYELRVAGRDYRDLRGEGGILRSARMLAASSDEDVLAFCRPLVEEMARHGTSALEMKTGYGLSVEGELRQARLARRLADLAPQTCTVTLLACHAVPDGLERSEWVGLACEELIPRAAEEGVADAVDVYVEDIAFDIADLRRVHDAAERAALPLRCHADQLAPSGAAEEAVRLGARSADHLNHVSVAGIAALGRSRTTAVLAPAATFSLRAQTPPVAELTRSGASVAIATDFNPGTSATLSIPETIAMACTLYGMSPRAALAGATGEAARVLGLDDRLGTLEVGKRADLLVLDVGSVAEVPYRPGHNPVSETYIAGRLVPEN